LRRQPIEVGPRPRSGFGGRGPGVARPRTGGRIVAVGPSATAAFAVALGIRLAGQRKAVRGVIAMSAPALTCGDCGLRLSPPAPPIARRLHCPRCHSILGWPDERTMAPILVETPSKAMTTPHRGPRGLSSGLVGFLVLMAAIAWTISQGRR